VRPASSPSKSNESCSRRGRGARLDAELLVDALEIGGATLGRAVFEPGWKWSTSVQPLAKTRSCEAPHFQYHVSGVLRILMDDGTEFDCRAGDVSLLPSGHDAWVLGNEPAVVVDFQGMIDYAKAHSH
jgi:hypothetical protein